MKTQASFGVPQIVSKDLPETAADKKGVSLKLSVDLNVDREVVVDMVDTALRHAREAGDDVFGKVMKGIVSTASFIGAHATQAKEKDDDGERGGLVSSAFSAIRGASTLLDSIRNK